MGGDDLHLKPGKERASLHIGPGIRSNAEGRTIRVLPTITVDYRKDGISVADFSNRRPTLEQATGSIASPAVPAACKNDIECDDGNPCTQDACTDLSCSGGPLGGSPCSVDEDCKGTCAGGANPGTPCTDDLACCGTPGTCSGSGDVCTGDLDCPTGETCGGPGFVATGTCTFFTCATLAQKTCINFLVPSGFVVPECDDGLECNGLETCTAGVCGAGTPLCAGQPELVCDEAANACVRACEIGGTPGDPGVCDDGLFCNGVEKCSARRCTAGDADKVTGNIQCQLNSECDTQVAQGDGVCTTGSCSAGDPALIGSTCQANTDCDTLVGQGDGVCGGNLSCLAGNIGKLPDNNGIVCTTDIDCDSPGKCTNNVCTKGRISRFCNSNADCAIVGDGVCGVASGECISPPAPCGPGGGCTECAGDSGTCPQAFDLSEGFKCDQGRCCDNTATCAPLKFASCDTGWLATSDPCALAPPSNNKNDCPEYAAGIAPLDDPSGPNVGPVSIAGVDLRRVGDDYATQGATGSGFIEVEFLRFLIDVTSNARVAIEFWDTSFDPPILIEDVFFPDGTNFGVGLFLASADFDPPLTIPDTGVIAFSVQKDFGPNGRFSILATDAIDAGTGNTADMFVNGALTGGDYLGQCAGGDRDGLWCNRMATNPNDPHQGCNGGACNDIPDVLAFEIVGTPRPDSPAGACCSSATGVCSIQLPWECLAGGGSFQGEGASCTICSGNAFVKCTSDAECSVCVGGPNDGNPCSQNSECPGTGAFCDVNGTCIDLLTCQTNSCFGADGSCTEVQGGNCSVTTTTTCNTDLDCPMGETCEPDCGALATAQGFGTDCITGQGGIGNPPNGGSCAPHAYCMGNQGTLACLSDVDCPAGSCSLTPATSCHADTDCPDGSCSVTTATSCRVDADCPAGSCSVTTATSCNVDTDCPMGETCVGGETCDNVETCDNAETCVGAVPCVGFSGGDTCLSAPVHVLTIPAVGEPPRTITVTGNNSTATFGDFFASNCSVTTSTLCSVDTDCPAGSCSVTTSTSCHAKADCPIGETCIGGETCEATCGAGIFNPDGTTQDPGWWEAVELVGQPCANLRIDLCCSDINGEPLRPAWGNLVTACNPCVFTGNDGIDPPLGVGTGTSGFARGAPFCDEDNLWQTYGPLAPGTYYYPIYSAPDGTFASPPGGTYQIHFTAAACAPVACCLPGGCQLLDELTCEAQGGYALSAANTGGDANVVNCGSGTINDPFVCAIGSCCGNKGKCEDAADPNVPCDPATPATCMDQALCDITGGTFTGGAQCFNDTRPCPTCAIDAPDNCQPDTGSFIFFDDRVNGGTRRIADDFIANGPSLSQLCWNPGFLEVGATANTECSDPGDTPPDNWNIRFYASDANGFPLPTPLHEILNAPIGAKEHIPGFRVWKYTAFFDPPLTGFSPGQRYWLEISGAGVPGACRTFWANSDDGNGLALFDTNPDPNRGPWTPEDFGNTDFIFCLDFGITVPPPVVGSCCECAGVCTDGVQYWECRGDTDVNTGNPVGANLGQWDLGTCVSNGCATQNASGCPGALSLGGDCELPLDVSSIPPDGMTFSTRCASTDGQIDMQGACDNETAQFFNDVWFTWNSTCFGRASINLCGDADFDQIVAIYQNPDGSCPSPSQCPLGNDLLKDSACFDFVCPGSGVVAEGATPEPTFKADVNVGDCLLIRIGGEGASDVAGRGNLRITCKECPISDPVTLVGQTVPGTGITQNRNLSIIPGNPGRDTAIRVTFVKLPPPFNVANGLVQWVGPAKEICENSGQGAGVPLDQCGATLGQPGSDPQQGIQGPTLWIAPLQCDPFYTDWATLTNGKPINVRSEFIVPSANGSPVIPATYSIDVVDSDCRLADPQSFSPALTVTNPISGDVMALPCDNFATCGSPNGNVDITQDVTFVLNMFSNLEKAPGKARSDVGPLAIDNKVGISDVTQVLDAFGQKPFPFGPPSLPCGFVPTPIVSGSE